MADDLGSIAWSFLPENEQVQYLHKIAQMRKKSIQAQVIPKKTKRNEKRNGTSNYFPHEVRFSAAYWRQHIFRPSLRY